MDIVLPTGIVCSFEPGSWRRGGAAARVRKVGRIGAEVEADAADGGHAMREPQLVAIGWLRRFRSIAIVAMHIDEAGQDIHALGIDHALHVLRLGGGRAAGDVERAQAHVARVLPRSIDLSAEPRLTCAPRRVKDARTPWAACIDRAYRLNRPVVPIKIT